MTFWNITALVTFNCSLLMESVMSLVVYTEKASWILSSFYLINSRIGENRRLKVHQIECDMLRNKVHLGNTMGDCFEDESGIISYYLDE